MLEEYKITQADAVNRNEEKVAAALASAAAIPYGKVLSKWKWRLSSTICLPAKRKLLSRKSRDKHNQRRKIDKSFRWNAYHGFQEHPLQKIIYIQLFISDTGQHITIKTNRISKKIWISSRERFCRFDC
jgi:hypothetical protein